MNFWSTSEAWHEVADIVHGLLYKKIQPLLNELLKIQELDDKAECWAIILVVVPDEMVSIFPESYKRTEKGKTLEFRLQIDYSKFITSSEREQTVLIFEALYRSLVLMESMKVSSGNIEKLFNVLKETESKVLSI